MIIIMGRGSKLYTPYWKLKWSEYESEEDVRKLCIDYLNRFPQKFNYFCRVDRKSNVRDLGYCPDLIVWVRRVYGIETITFELKTPQGSGRLRAKQENFVEWLGISKHRHYIINRIEDFIKYLEAK